MKERRETERNMMIKEEAAENISGGGRGLRRRTVAASQHRTKKDEVCDRASAIEMAERGGKQGVNAERNEVR